MSGISTTRHHADWLSLVEVSGPFVSMPVLLRTFPQGLVPRDAAQAKELHVAYDEWQENPDAPGKHRSWIMHVLTAVLGYPTSLITEGQTIPAGIECKMPEMGEILRPDYALVGPAGSETSGLPQLLINGYPETQKLDGTVSGKLWKASPGTRMMELLHATGVPVGLITNGAHWMLVYAPRGETTGYASWYSNLWIDEPITLRAFQSLLGVSRFFGVATDSTLLAMLKESAQDQQEVTDQLGYQVREAVEVLVQAFDEIDRENNHALLKDVTEKTLYEASLTVMMRLVFLFSAEERGLLYLGKPLYDENYAVSTLQEQLQEVADRYGEEVLERRTDAWIRLLATFRVVFGGINHQDLLIPAYGGTLFDPDKYPFLEGRDSGTTWAAKSDKPLAVNNRVTLHLLNSLQRLRVKMPGGGPAETRRISFRALGIEQIGHVYEGLLDHTAVRATEPVLGLKGSRDKEPELPLSVLETHFQQGIDKFTGFLKEETGRSITALKGAIDEYDDSEEHKLLIACEHDKALLEKIRPFAGLIRQDSFEHPIVILAGSVYVTAGNARRSTGTHYTPPTLTEPIVQHTLEPLVYEGPAEGWPKEQWKLKSPKAILDLKVCDMAMGSGAFLVQVCRYLAERLVEAWENVEKSQPADILVVPYGEKSQGVPSERLLPNDSNERLAIARRLIADRCLYGVDINPMAVEMAKLSLWLITVQRDRPFTFLDHALKCGDSLLGVSTVRQIENFSLRPDVKQVTFATANLFRYVDDAADKRRVLEDMPSNDHTQIETKNRLHAEAEAAVAKVKAIGDCLIAFELRGLDGAAYEKQRTATAEQVQLLLTSDADARIEMSNPKSGLGRAAYENLRGRRPFHWPVEFPEVFTLGGFDVFVGNPPFMGGKKVTSALGECYRNIVVRAVAEGAVGAADLCVYFFLRVIQLLRATGVSGLLATNSICEGDNRTVGLTKLLLGGTKIFRAIPSQPWPGQAGVNVAVVFLAKKSWAGLSFLGNQQVNEISDYLTPVNTSLLTGDPFSLVANAGLAFAGTYVNGDGFILTPEEAAALISEDPKNKDVVFKYLTGKDVASETDQRATRYVINFHTWDRGRAEQYARCFAILTERVKTYRNTLTKQVHETDYWKFWDKRLESYKTISKLERVLVAPRVSKLIVLNWVPNDQVFSDQVVVFTRAEPAILAIFQSSIHQEWAWTYCSTIREAGIRYAPSKAVDTFPLPHMTEGLGSRSVEYGFQRQCFLESHKCGLTDFYNKLNDPGEQSTDIARLRTLHMEMDQTVAAAYGWGELDLDHGFHETKQGIRYTISEVARRKVLDLLLALNHQRYEEEVKAGQHHKKAKGEKRKSKNRHDDDLLFDEKNLGGMK